MKTKLIYLLLIVAFAQVKCRNVDSYPRVDFYIDLLDPAYTSLYITGNYVYVNGVIVFKGLDQDYYALSQYCTTDFCNVAYQVAYNELVCPCDQLHYDLYGNEMWGNGNPPLYPYATFLSGSLLHVYTP
jgi:Rieske Fe-S protein